MPILCPHKHTHFFSSKKKKKKKSRKETGIIFSFLLADLEIKIHREEVNSVVSDASMKHLFLKTKHVCSYMWILTQML